jgi:hypothetical protein
MVSSTPDAFAQPVDRKHLFRVGDQDFHLIFGGNSRLFSSHQVTVDGVFVVPLKYGEMLEPEELQLFTHLTGDRREPLLSFPCSLAQLFDFCADEGYGQVANEALVDWMIGRVELLRRRRGWEWLDALGDVLFTVYGADVSALLPDLADGLTNPSVPCSLKELLVWCDGDDAASMRARQPENAKITALVFPRLMEKPAVDDRVASAAVTGIHHGRRRSIGTILRILEARSIKQRQVVQVLKAAEIEAADEAALLALISERLDSAGIPNRRGSVKAITTAAVAANIVPPSPKTISSILHDVGNYGKSNNR